MLGANFEREIREQPDVWRRIAESDRAHMLARAIRGRDVVLLGSGSSLFMAQLGALALRRRGIRAVALAASEAPLDHAAYRDAVVVACSQSGETTDLIEALDLLRPMELIALTNTPDSPLSGRADVVIDLGAGPEVAVPASKSVTASAAILLWAAAIASDTASRNARVLIETAEDVRGWLDGDGVEAVRDAAERIARRRSVVIVAAGYGVPIAYECSLKLKEASYIHAEGISAGEFRHGSAAMLDASCAIVGIVDEHSRGIVNRPLREALEAESLRYVFGERLADIPLIGPVVGIAFNTLAWLVAGQMLALYLARARHVDADAPRGLNKKL